MAGRTPLITIGDLRRAAEKSSSRSGTQRIELRRRRRCPAGTANGIGQCPTTIQSNIVRRVFSDRCSCRSLGENRGGRMRIFSLQGHFDRAKSLISPTGWTPRSELQRLVVGFVNDVLRPFRAANPRRQNLQPIVQTLTWIQVFVSAITLPADALAWASNCIEFAGFGLGRVSGSSAIAARKPRKSRPAANATGRFVTQLKPSETFTNCRHRIGKSNPAASNRISCRRCDTAVWEV